MRAVLAMRDPAHYDLKVERRCRSPVLGLTLFFALVKHVATLDFTITASVLKGVLMMSPAIYTTCGAVGVTFLWGRGGKTPTSPGARRGAGRAPRRN